MHLRTFNSIMTRLLKYTAVVLSSLHLFSLQTTECLKLWHFAIKKNKVTHKHCWNFNLQWKTKFLSPLTFCCQRQGLSMLTAQELPSHFSPLSCYFIWQSTIFPFPTQTVFFVQLYLTQNKQSQGSLEEPNFFSWLPNGAHHKTGLS